MSRYIIRVHDAKVKVTQRGQNSNKIWNVYSDHLVIIYWGIETQMVIIMTTGVKRVIWVNICKVKVTKDDRNLAR
jgi:hypothetical protein